MSLRQRGYLTLAEMKLRRPSKSQVNALVAAFAKKLYASRHSPGARVEQRIDRAFFKKHQAMVDKYPHVDLDSSQFWAGLELAADKYISKQVTMGAGKDW